jgi:hypothetical protein
MESEKPHSLRGLILKSSCVFLGIFAIYVLSLGPVAYLYSKRMNMMYQTQRDYERRARYFRIHAPLIKATEGTAFNGPLQLYVGWWTSRGMRSNTYMDELKNSGRFELPFNPPP